VGKRGNWVVFARITRTGTHLPWVHSFTISWRDITPWLQTIANIFAPCPCQEGRESAAISNKKERQEPFFHNRLKDSVH